MSNLDFLSDKRIPEDLKPTTKEQRNWTFYSFFAVWIGMDIGIPTYYLASSLISGGMNLPWALFVILLANIIIAFPILANGHAGAKYGIPSTVYWRSAFGFNGAGIAAILRGVVAAGWCGIQFWIGGSALNTVLGLLFPAWATWGPGKWICFFGFTALNIFILVNGMGAIQKLEHLCAPMLVIWMIVLVVWARITAGSWGPLVSQAGQFASSGEFFAFFVVGLNANISYWASMPLTVTDLTKCAKDQKSQMAGQFLGIPLGIFGLALVGSLVTSCTVVMFGEAVWDPVTLTGMIGSVPLVIGMMFFLILATLTTNIAANALTPAVAIVHLTGGRINFKWAAIVLAVIGIAIRPWVLISDMGVYMNFFLNGGGALLGPIIGITICHYWFVSHTELDLKSLYLPEGESMFNNVESLKKKAGIGSIVVAAILLIIAFVAPAEWRTTICSLSCTRQFSMIGMAIIIAVLGVWTLVCEKSGKGINPVAIITMDISFIIIFLGLWSTPLHWFYDASIIVGTIVGMILYYVLMKVFDPELEAAKKKEHANAPKEN